MATSLNIAAWTFIFMFGLVGFWISNALRDIAQAARDSNERLDLIDQHLDSIKLELEGIADEKSLPR